MTKTPPTIPVTVVGGFLGAGKTTFLNHLLKTSRSRYAVLVNDFGEINIDAGLIAQHDGATMTLTNGCVCCSIGGGFIETLGAVLDNAVAFDHIIIEASGVGDPWRIAEIALVEPSLRLNAVIVLADATRIETLLRDARVGATVRNQFERANLVLLNKTDLIDKAATCAASAAISALRDGMRIIATSEQAMPDLPMADRTLASPFRADPAPAGANHEQTFRRWSYRRIGVFDRVRLKDALRELPSSLLRLKGSCLFAGDSAPSLLQMVGGDWSLTRLDQLPSAITLVGVGTDELPETAELDRILDRALNSALLPFINDNGGVQSPAPPFHLSREGHTPCR
ncbi:GTP-binding protein [soil metagenome]